MVEGEVLQDVLRSDSSWYSSGAEPDLHGDATGEDEALIVEGPGADLPAAGPNPGSAANLRSETYSCPGPVLGLGQLCLTLCVLQATPR